MYPHCTNIQVSNVACIFATKKGILFCISKYHVYLSFQNYASSFTIDTKYSVLFLVDFAFSKKK